MTNSFRRIFFFVATLGLTGATWAGTLQDQGKAWLDEHKEPPLVNVNGIWDSDFGVIHLEQAQGSRDVSGTEGKYTLQGVVSGKMLYLLFGSRGHTVDYCAVVSATGDKLLEGNYYYWKTRLKFGAGLCQDKGYWMSMRKQ